MGTASGGLDWRSSVRCAPDRARFRVLTTVSVRGIPEQPDGEEPTSV